jgi:hypothetical protein
VSDKSEATLANLRDYLNVIEVEKDFNMDCNNECVLTSGSLVRMGLQYSSILLFMYGKFVGDAFGTISGDDCLLATSLSNGTMITFIGTFYQKLAKKFITAEPNDFTVEPNSIEYLFYCFQGSRNAKNFNWATIFYNEMKAMPNFDVERMCCKNI